MYKLKKIPLLLSVLLLFLQGCSGNDITASDMQGKKFFYQVSDAYSTSNYTLEELEELKKNSSFIDNLQKFNTELNSTDTVDFYDMKYETVDFIGKWNKPKDLANGYGHKDLTDQEVTIKGKNEYITPVNVFSLNKKTMEKLAGRADVGLAAKCQRLWRRPLRTCRYRLGRPSEPATRCTNFR